MEGTATPASSEGRTNLPSHGRKENTNENDRFAGDEKCRIEIFCAAHVSQLGIYSYLALVVTAQAVFTT